MVCLYADVCIFKRCVDVLRKINVVVMEPDVYMKIVLQIRIHKWYSDDKNITLTMLYNELLALCWFTVQKVFQSFSPGNDSNKIIRL